MSVNRIVTIILFSSQLLMGMEPKVIAWNLDHLSSNAKTGSLVATALTRPCSFLAGKGLWTATKIVAGVWDIANQATEIAEGDKNKNIPPTYGKANIIYKLLNYMSRTYCSPSNPFTEKDAYNFCDLAVEPEMNNDNTALANYIKTLRQRGVISIGICEQDPLEHSIYAKKMAANQYPMDDLFNAIIGIPSIIENKELASSAQSLESSGSNFVIAESPYPSKAFIETLKKTARTLAAPRPQNKNTVRKVSITVIDDPSELSSIVTNDPQIVLQPFTTLEEIQQKLSIQ